MVCKNISLGPTSPPTFARAGFPAVSEGWIFRWAGLRLTSCTQQLTDFTYYVRLLSLIVEMLCYRREIRRKQETTNIDLRHRKKLIYYTPKERLEIPAGPPFCCCRTNFSWDTNLAQAAYCHKMPSVLSPFFLIFKQIFLWILFLHSTRSSPLCDSIPWS